MPVPGAASAAFLGSQDRNTARSISRGTGVGGTTGETRTYHALSRMLTNADDDYSIEYEHEVNGLRSVVY